LQSVYGPTKKDIRQGLIFALASILVIWVTILLANKGG